MKNKKVITESFINRRKFLTIAGLSASFAVYTNKIFAGKNEYRIQDNLVTNHEKIDLFSNSIAEVLETKLICFEPGIYLGQETEYVLNTNGMLIASKKVKEPNRYLGWPTLLKTNTNELIVAFSGDRDAHICPYGKTQVIRSKDNGKTWSEPQTINNTPLDDRDAGIMQTSKGTLIISWFTSLAFEMNRFQNPAANKSVEPPAAYNRYVRIGEKIPKETKKKWLGHWIRRSEDMGKTWGDPIATAVKTPHGPVSLKNGDVLLIGKGIWENELAIVIQISKDDGNTWQLVSHVPNGRFSVKFMEEPHLVELKSGKIISMIRNEPTNQDQCFLLQSESLDGGKTWSEMRSSGIWGYPPHLKQLKNGWLLVSYGYRKQPYSERACISKDEGKTWDIENEIILSAAPARDLGYPSSVELDDGSILTVYYQAPKIGEPACIYSTHWRLT